jgi:antitoxin component YwqK of YwqJK toxin-antitoxin module
MKYKIRAILLIVISTVIFFVDRKLNFQITKLNSKDLSVKAFGFDFKKKPFTGLIYNVNEQKNIDKIIFILNGLRHGSEIHWYENGQRWVERNYKLGLEEGLQKTWYPDGTPFSFKSFKDGQPNGEFFEWFKDGKISSFVKYVNGTEVVAKTWTGSGKPFYNYTWKNKERIGLLGDRYCTKLK